jgi:hypothetical protein
VLGVRAGGEQQRVLGGLLDLELVAGCDAG